MLSSSSSPFKLNKVTNSSSVFSLLFSLFFEGFGWFETYDNYWDFRSGFIVFFINLIIS